MYNALYCNEKVGVRGCIMHNGGIPDRVIADTIDILPLLTALSGNTIRSNPMKCKKNKKKEVTIKTNVLAKYFTTASILCCITNYNSAFPIFNAVQCSNNDEKCKPAH